MTNITSQSDHVCFRVKSYAKSAAINCTVYYYDRNTTSSGFYNIVDFWRFNITDNSKVQLSDHYKELFADEGFTLKANTDNGCYSSGFDWSSSNNLVTHIDNYGNSAYIKALKSGEATITVKLANGSYDECNILVKTILPNSVALPDEFKVFVGQEVALDPVLSPENAHTSFTWKIDDNSLVNVNGNTFFGVKEGESDFYVTTSNGKVSNKCHLSVSIRKPDGISIEPISNMQIGKSQNLKIKFSPSYAQSDITWTSTNPNIITVSDNEKVEAHAEGTATIFAYTQNGLKASIDVTVNPDPSDIVLPNKISLYHNKGRSLKYEIFPDNASVDLSWESTDKSIINVSNNGYVQALSPGAANVIVRTHNGKSATCRVEVQEPNYILYAYLVNGERHSYPVYKLPEISSNDNELVIKSQLGDIHYSEDDVSKFTLVDEGSDSIPTKIEITSTISMMYNDKIQIEYRLFPLDYDIETELEWTSTNIHVVSVNKEGIVHAVGNGEADVIVKASNGVNNSCHITVFDAPSTNLIVKLKDSSIFTFPLQEDPYFTYLKDSLIFMSTATKLKFNVNDVDKILIEYKNSEESSISNTTVKNEYFGKTVKLEALTPQSMVLVYDTAGKLYKAYKVDSTGSLSFSVENYRNGMYIIRTNNSSFKILKK